MLIYFFSNDNIERMSFTTHTLITQVQQEILLGKINRVIQRSERKWDIDLNKQCKAI